MEMIYTDARHVPQGILRGFTLDMAYGDDENDFELTVPTDRRIGTLALVYEYGTERGGVIDAERYDNTGDAPLLSYTGRTWHGILDNSVVRPPAGADYLTLTGDANDCIRSLIARQGLGDIFTAREGYSGLVLDHYQVPRYVTAYGALVRIASHFGKRLGITKASGKAEISLEEVTHLTGGVSGETAGISVENNDRSPNHLVLLGKGELSSRLVLDVYADENGNVSQTQTFHGIDEVAKVYESSAEEDPAKLLKDGIEKLEGMQQKSSVMLSVPDGAAFHIGDIVRGVASDFGLAAEAEIIKQIITVDKDGTMYVDCVVGSPTFAPTF